MINLTDNESQHCLGCVYYPPNLPADAYPQDDYAILQTKNCSFDYLPYDELCMTNRKTSCSLVKL